MFFTRNIGKIYIFLKIYLKNENLSVIIKM